MPYSIRKQKRGYAIVNNNTGKVVGHARTKKDALASRRARLAGEHGWRKRRRR